METLPNLSSISSNSEILKSKSYFHLRSSPGPPGYINRTYLLKVGKFVYHVIMFTLFRTLNRYQVLGGGCAIGNV